MCSFSVFFESKSLAQLLHCEILLAISPLMCSLNKLLSPDCGIYFSKILPDLLELTLCRSKTICYSVEILITLKKIQSIR